MAEQEGAVDEEVERVLYALGKAVDEFVSEHYPEGMGFFVAMFQFGPGGRFNYISNSRRDDIVRLLEEMIVKFKGS